MGMIDILLATYNGEEYLEEQMDSVLTQSNKDWRLLIRDDGSDDNTVSIIKDYVARYPDRITLIEDDNRHLGVSLNFQRLLENSTADYVMFCDQDDVWLPQKIEATLNLMKDTEKDYPNKPVLVHTDLRVVDSRLKTIAKSTWRYQGTCPETGNDPAKVLAQNVVTGCTIMINRKTKEISMPIPEEAVVHDWWLVINVASHGKVAHIPDQLVLYRQHASNAVGAKKLPRMNFSFFFTQTGVKIQYLFSLRKKILDHYKMVKKYDPHAAFWPVIFKKTVTKIAHVTGVFGRKKVK